MLTDINHSVAELTIRMIAGILFFFQGYDKVFHIGMKEVKQTMKVSLENHRFPESLIGPIAVITSWIELICGFLLIIGFFKYYAIYLLCLSLIGVVFGFSLAKPMWENSHVFFRLLLLITLLITPVEWDRFSIDYLFALAKLNV